MRCDDRNNTKRLWGFLSILVSLKNYTGYCKLFLKSLPRKDSKSVCNDDDNKEETIKTIKTIITITTRTLIIIIVMVVTKIERGTKIYFISNNNAILAQTYLHFFNKE